MSHCVNFVLEFMIFVKTIIEKPTKMKGRPRQRGGYALRLNSGFRMLGNMLTDALDVYIMRLAENP